MRGRNFEPTFLVYRGGEVFQSKLVSGLESAFDVVVQFIFGEAPDPVEEPDAFDEFVVLKNDFENKSFWKDEGCVWETDFETGYVTIVKITSILN